MKNSPLRIGVAGLGFGARTHVPAFQSLPGVRVVAIAGTSLEKTKMVAKRLNVPKACGSLEELFKEKLDAVSFALPPFENEKAVSMALSRRIPILSEKPIAGSKRIAQKFAKEAKGMPAMVDFEFMEIPAFQRLKKIIDKKTFGSIRHGQLTWLVESMAQKNRVWSWKTDARRGGGVVSILGSHFFFLVEWLISPIINFKSQLSHNSTKLFCPPGGIPADDLAHFLLTLKGDIPFSAVIGNASPGGLRHRWEIVFDKAAVSLYNNGSDQFNGFRITANTGASEKTIFTNDVEQNKVKESSIVPFLPLAKRFIKAVREKKPNVFPDFSIAARIQDYIDNAYKNVCVF